MSSNGASPLVTEARALRSGTGDPTRLLAAFRGAVLYFQIGDTRHPSVLVTVVPDMGRWVCVYSSLDAMARAVGRECRYAQTTGADIADNIIPALRLVADITGVMLDLRSDHELPFGVAALTGDAAHIVTGGSVG